MRDLFWEMEKHSFCRRDQLVPLAWVWVSAVFLGPPCKQTTFLTTVTTSRRTYLRLIFAFHWEAGRKENNSICFTLKIALWIWATLLVYEQDRFVNTKRSLRLGCLALPVLSFSSSRKPDISLSSGEAPEDWGDSVLLYIKQKNHYAIWSLKSPQF